MKHGSSIPNCYLRIFNGFLKSTIQHLTETISPFINIPFTVFHSLLGKFSKSTNETQVLYYKIKMARIITTMFIVLIFYQTIVPEFTSTSFLWLYSNPDFTVVRKVEIILMTYQTSIFHEKAAFTFSMRPFLKHLCINDFSNSEKIVKKL